MKLGDKIRTKQKEIDKLYSQRKQNNKRMRNRWSGKFVNQNRNGIYINPKPTEIGLKELAINNIEYLKEIPKEFKEFFWKNPGISYTPKKCFCMICHSTNTDAWLQLGICPRFATCPKHVDFLMLHSNLKKKKKHGAVK